jgi:hypothetical protein
MNNRDAFTKYKPAMVLEVRGNAVNDSTTFVSRGGATFDRFKVAYSPAKDAPSLFLDVLVDATVAVGKGDFVKVVGDYRENTNTDDNGKEWLNRTIFANSVEVLGTKQEPKVETTTPSRKGAKKGK